MWIIIAEQWTSRLNMGLSIVKTTPKMYNPLNALLLIYEQRNDMPKRTHQPKKRSRAREHGFLKRMASKAGRNVLKRRRTKGRAKISA